MLAFKLIVCNQRTDVLTVYGVCNPQRLRTFEWLYILNGCNMNNGFYVFLFM